MTDPMGRVTFPCDGTPVSAQIRRRAVRAVCSAAADKHDAAELLEALDLHPGEGR